MIQVVFVFVLFGGKELQFLPSFTLFIFYFSKQFIHDASASVVFLLEAL